MEDLGFFPYPSMASFGSPFEDVIMDPGPTSFFLKESSGEDILLGQGLDQLQTKLGLDLFKEENNGSPINVDDDWLMKDLSGMKQKYIVEKKCRPIKKQVVKSIFEEKKWKITPKI